MYAHPRNSDNILEKSGSIATLNDGHDQNRLNLHVFLKVKFNFECLQYLYSQSRFSNCDNNHNHEYTEMGQWKHKHLQHGTHTRYLKEHAVDKCVK